MAVYRFRIARVGIFAFALLLMMIISAPQVQSHSVVVDAATECKPGHRDGCGLQQDQGGMTHSAPPAPGSKNALTPSLVDNDGVTTFGPAVPGTKNSFDAPQTIAPATAGAAGWRFVSCGDSGDATWTTTDNGFQTIRSCTLNVAESGFVYVNATASAGLGDNPYEARFRIGVDDTAGVSSTDRWTNVYTDTWGDGTDKSIVDTLFAPVSAGPHTFSFLGSRYGGVGTVTLYDPALSVLYIPASSTDIQMCGSSSSSNWTTTAGTFQAIASCSLTLAQSGFVYLTGTASAVLPNGSSAYEARVRVGVGVVDGSADSDRWVNVYPDAGDGTDEVVSTSLLLPAAAGANTFYFSGLRYNGTGTVTFSDPTLTAIFFPAPSASAKLCSATNAGSWTTTSSTFATVLTCSVQVPRDSLVFVDASASGGMQTNTAGDEWEGLFRIGFDSDIGSGAYDRWLNAYSDTGADGTDRVLANTALMSVPAGTHTFSFVGRRFAGNGTVLLNKPTLTVIVPGTAEFLPLLRK